MLTVSIKDNWKYIKVCNDKSHTGLVDKTVCFLGAFYVFLGLSVSQSINQSLNHTLWKVHHQYCQALGPSSGGSLEIETINWHWSLNHIILLSTYNRRTHDTCFFRIIVGKPYQNEGFLFIIIPDITQASGIEHRTETWQRRTVGGDKIELTSGWSSGQSISGEHFFLRICKLNLHLSKAQKNYERT